MYHIKIEVYEGKRHVTNLDLEDITAERLMKGALEEFREAAKFLEGIVREDVENMGKLGVDVKD